MTFLGASWLWLLLAVGAVAAAHVATGRRPSPYAARRPAAPSLARPGPSRWRRTVPALLVLATLTAAVVALARPTRVRRVPRNDATVMLAIDVSNSMEATDVRPDRLLGAEAGALEFVGRLPPPVQVGLVAFASGASVLVGPTTDRDALDGAIRGLRLGTATAIGDAIVASLRPLAANPAGAAVVLLSDGETTVGVPNDTAVAAARRARIPVDTIAYGTPDGFLDVGGQHVPVPVNAAALRAIADGTGGSYHRATSGDELRAVYDQLGATIGYRTVHHEVTTWFVGLAVAFGLAGAAASLALSPRLP